MGVFKRRVNSNKKESVFWYIRYSLNGKDKWESVGKVGDITKTVAERKLQEVKRKIRMGVYEYEDENTTLESLENEYITHVKEIKELRTWKKRKQHYQTLKAFFKDKTLCQITPKDIEDFKLFRIKKLKPASVNRELETLRHVINVAKRWKRYYGENPVSIAGLMTVNNQRDRVLNIEEEKNLLACSAPHLQPILFTALNTGMRKGEMLSLTWNDVDLDNDLITVRSEVSKSKKQRQIPINSLLRKVLLEQKIKTAHSGFVFLTPEGLPYSPNNPSALKRTFGTAFRNAEIKGFRFHDLRHTAATQMAESGAVVVAVKEILGHADIRTTMKYFHPEKSVREAVEILANLR